MIEIRIALREMVKRGGRAVMGDLYAAVEAVVNAKAFTLSEQGKTSLRFFINKIAVEAGYVNPHDRSDPGWRITERGREFASEPESGKDEKGNKERAIDTDTGQETIVRQTWPAATRSSCTS